MISIKSLNLFFMISFLILSIYSCANENQKTEERGANLEDSQFTYGGKLYHTIKIGNQTWLKENLDVGIMIKGDLNETNNDTIEKYCYNDDQNNCISYGGLYQWAETVQYLDGATNKNYATNKDWPANTEFSGNVKGICPSGWHIPNRDEMQILIETLNSNKDAFNKFWQGSLSDAENDTSNFSPLLPGYCDKSGKFLKLNESASIWCTTQYHGYSDEAYSLVLNPYTKSVFLNKRTPKRNGISVRCIKD